MLPAAPPASTLPAPGPAGPGGGRPGVYLAAASGAEC